MPRAETFRVDRSSLAEAARELQRLCERADPLVGVGPVPLDDAGELPEPRAACAALDRALARALTAAAACERRVTARAEAVAGLLSEGEQADLAAATGLRRGGGSRRW